MMLYCPQILPDAWTGPRIPGARFLDPGLAREPVEGGFRPEALPCDPREARRLLNNFLGLGEQYRKPGDQIQVQSLPHPGLAGSESAIQAELGARLGLGNAPASAPGDAAAQETARFVWRQRSQLLLLLAQHREERLAESRELSQRMAASLSRFDTIIGDGLGEGLESESTDAEGVDLEALRLGRVAADFAVPAEDEDPAPWRPVLGAMLCFLPAGTVLVTTEAALVEALEEGGTVFGPAGELSGLSGEMSAELAAYRAARVTAVDLARAAFETEAVVPGLDPGAEFVLVLAA